MHRETREIITVRWSERVAISLLTGKAPAWEP
jgi:hypothetical protein